MLQEHIEKLRRRFAVDVFGDSEICIVLRDYPIPASIWDRDKADLLVVAHPTYPNARMDMFWVDPPISLKNGNAACATSTDSQCGRTWQRFSWHVASWNPAHDNLITYLDVVNRRLGMNE